ncbi:hypothetical protein RHSIM_Rhsim07G0159100 [Rhododendron simsii]|uniref:Protein FAR1-RELATED SEQUENCE n=1 Tax=Rhododendron simsii TaxID=118357 RepID=A0A834GYC2_RHOSS|nr:hypothetical protein RHSIM_Rhsim07G0159100 [Rhododendron simsii]
MVEDNPRAWYELLFEALWAYRTSKKEATNITPYMLVYGHDLVLPMEVTVKSARIAYQNGLTPADYTQVMLIELEDLDEVRLAALDHMLVQKKRVARSYYKHVRRKSFSEGDLVWKAVFPLGEKNSRYGKWSPTWEGPYQIAQVLRDDVEANDMETPENVEEGLKTPTIGMYFETIEETRNYYERYGQENRFGFVLGLQAKDETDRMKSLSEGINSFFDGFVTYTSNLKEFVVKHEKALKRIVKRENDEDFKSEHKFRTVNDHEFLLKPAAKVYIRNAFNKFKDEWSKVFYYKVEDERNANGFQSFIVKSKDDELEKFEVTLDSQTYECKYECQQFEFVGILCAHILKVFVRLDIDEIPEHFILPRWRQRANKFRIIGSQRLVHDDSKEESKALRLSHMCQEATKLACLAAPSIEAYTIFIEGMNDLFEKIQEVSKVSPIEIFAEKDNKKFTELSPSLILLLDPNISICKGRKKDVKGKAASTQCERLKSGIEMSLNKKKRKCHMCFQFGHEKRTCPSNPMSKTKKGFEEDAEGSDSDQEDGSDYSE